MSQRTAKEYESSRVLEKKRMDSPNWTMCDELSAYFCRQLTKEYGKHWKDFGTPVHSVAS